MTAAFSGLGMLANRLEQRPSPAQTGLSLAHGAWIGAWSPLLFTDTPEPSQLTGALRLGLGAGYGSTLLMAALSDNDPSATSSGLQVAGWAGATALGAGIPLAIGDYQRKSAVVGPMLISGIGGQALGAALAPHYDLSRNDNVLLGTVGAWTTYQAVGWGVYGSLSGQQTERAFGHSLVAAGAGTLATVGLTPVIDLDPAGSVMLLSSGGWGTWYGAWSSQLADSDPDARLLTTLSTGNVALLASGVAQAAGWQPTWSDVAAIDGLGLIGAAGGGLAGVVLLYDPDNADPLVASTMVGSTLGLAGGAVWAAVHDGPDPKLNVGRGRIFQWSPSVSATPLQDDDGSTGAMVTVNLKERLAVR